MSGIEIRSATPGDAPRLLEIYSPYILNTAISFEYDVPSLEEFGRRIKSVQEKFPYLCLVAQNKIAGYAYASAFHERAAYRHCAELSIYLSADCRGKGYGRALYQALEGRLKKMGITNAYACVAVADEEDEYLTNASKKFHERMGFAECGRFHKCGKKFGRWYDMIWMEKFLAEREPQDSERTGGKESGPRGQDGEKKA